MLCYFSMMTFVFFFFSSRRRHTRSLCDWSSDVCSSDLRPEALNELAQSTYVGGPSGRTGPEEFRRALPLPFRPRQDMNREPIQWKTCQRSGWWTDLELTEPLLQMADYMANHFQRRESAPDRLQIGCHARD